MPKRIGATLSKALKLGLSEEKRLLDCYNNSVVTNGVSYTITTRINASNHYWVLEIDE